MADTGCTRAATLRTQPNDSRPPPAASLSPHPMVEAQGETTPSLAEQYLLKDKDEKVEVVLKPADVKEPESTVTATAAAAVETVKEATEATIAAVTPSAEESNDTAAPEEKAEDASAAAEESSDSAATEATEESSEATEEPAEAEEAPEIKIETAPADFRFPTTNQTRHCFTRYVEYHRCIAAKGDGAPECDKFAKYYRSLCPGEWVDKWNEQRENGTFPGPL